MTHRLSRDTARRFVERFPSTTVLVVGDLMLDHFLFGRVRRISPEAPVPVVEFDHDEYRPGGAANVAHNVSALGGRVALVGVIGSDEAGERLISALRGLGIATEGLLVDAGRPTTRKVRVVTSRHQQVARVDYELDTELAGATETAVAAHIDTAGRGVHAILVSDYLKGTITRQTMGRVVACRHARGIPVIVDPKIPHLEYYAGASLVTPNHQEAEMATHMRIRTDAETRAAGHALQARVGCDSVLITRGEHGMWLLDGTNGNEVSLPAMARDVADVTGAGDTVIATIGLAVAAGAPLAEAAELANHAAGVVVGKFGPATVTGDELVASFDRR